MSKFWNLIKNKRNSKPKDLVFLLHMQCKLVKVSVQSHPQHVSRIWIFKTISLDLQSKDGDFRILFST